MDPAAEAHAGSAPTISRSSSCTITPSSPTPRRHLFLSSADTIWRPFHYNQRILFFSLPPPCRSSFLERLRSSLASALVDFFPWAARLVDQDDGRAALDCNDAGVTFIEARVDIPFTHLSENRFDYQPFFEEFAPHVDFAGWKAAPISDATPTANADMPLLFVQVTRFPNDEGFVLGFSHSHVVADGGSLWQFMKSWGECARGVPLSMRPLHMREALGPDHLILPPRSLKEDGKPEHGSSPHPPPPPPPPLHVRKSQRNFHFSSDMVKKLKNMAESTCLTDHKPFSSLQALSAHLWKHMTAATDGEATAKSCYNLMANMRSKLHPPLPENYFGNALLRDGSVATKEELERESLGDTALRIQKLIKKLDDTFMRTLYGRAEVLPFHEMVEGMTFSEIMFQLSSSPRFPVYEVDFGWGPALSVQCPRIPGNGEMVWFPGREGGGSIDVSVALAVPVMERLEQDNSFLSLGR